MGERIEGQIRDDRRVHGDGKGFGGIGGVWKDSPFCVGGGCQHVSSRCQPLSQSFVAGEKEEAVFHNRASENSSKLVATEGRHRLRVKKVAGIHRAVAQELKHGPVEGVRATFAGDFNDRPQRVSVLSREVIGEDAVFPHCLHSRESSRHAARCQAGSVRDVNPIHDVSVVTDAHTAGGYLRSVTGVGFVNGVALPVNVRLQESKLFIAADIQRQIPHLGRIHQTAHGRGRGLNQGRFSGYRDRLGHRPDLQVEIHFRLPAEGQLNAAPDHGLEAR